MPNTQTISLSQGSIRVRDEGSGPSIVFVHGFLVDGRLWETTASALVASGHRVIVPDLPLGAHRVPLGAGADRSPRGVARLVLELIDHLGLDDVTLVGNDTGGAICQFVIDEQPDRIARLVLTNCDAFDQFPPAPFSVIHPMKRVPGLVTAVLATMRLRIGRRIGFDALTHTDMPDELLRSWCEPCLTDARIRRDTLAFLRAVKPADLVDVATRLPRYPGPVLLTWAPADRFFKLTFGERLRDTFTDARLVEIDEARTFVPIDQPERLAREIAGFVAERQAFAGTAVGAGSQSAG
jgi:pimeloyl-ACP methyl ester carboxylesterase